MAVLRKHVAGHYGRKQRSVAMLNIVQIMPDYFHVVFFFFSSRRRHTRLQGDWSSDVCSSDLVPWPRRHQRDAGRAARRIQLDPAIAVAPWDVRALLEAEGLIERDRSVLVGRRDHHELDLPDVGTMATGIIQIQLAMIPSTNQHRSVAFYEALRLEKSSDIP